jgi:hypothetical protein
MAGEYQFRMHADYGNGAFIGIDGPAHTPGNTWGILTIPKQDLAIGDHDFEALGFEDCCDGHAELEVHLPGCDADAGSPWRMVVSGTMAPVPHDCFRCTGDDSPG